MPKRVVCALAQCQRTQVGPHPPRAQRYGTCLGHRLDLELPIGHPVELWSISRHFAAQIPSLGQRSLCSQVINFLLSDRSLGMPIHSLASRGRATQLSFPQVMLLYVINPLPSSRLTLRTSLRYVRPRFSFRHH